MAILGFVLFLGASALSFGVIYASVAPQWRRIARLMSGQVEQPVMFVSDLSSAERRIAVRRWAAMSSRRWAERRAAA